MSYKVIDISEHNTSVDFKKLDVDAVILRVGYRGYGEAGNIVLDKKFKTYIANANKHNIPVGVYFYSQAVSSSEAKAEAKYVLSQIKGYRIDLPVYFDAEYAEAKGMFVGRLYNAKISKSKLTNIAKAFCDTIIINGYEAGVYANYDFFKNKYNVTELKAYSLWIAHYSANTIPKVAGVTFDMWQYTDDGKLTGVTGMVDMNKLYTDLIWREYKTTTNLNYRKSTDLLENSKLGTLPKGATVFAKSGSETILNGYTWVKAKKDKSSDECFYVANKYLRRV